jgi:hypothetical protein
MKRRREKSDKEPEDLFFPDGGGFAPPFFLKEHG